MICVFIPFYIQLGYNQLKKLFLMTKQRLSKTLAAAGVASRRSCEQLIFDGRVQVNGVVTLIPQTMVDRNDAITVDEKSIISPESKVYYIFNKPHGCICSSARHGRCKIVLDFFTGEPYRLFTVGRLDKDTTGLLLVTNDGHFANRVMHPSSNIQKEYLVKTDHEITPDHLTAISSGTLVEGAFVKPIKVTKVRKGTLKVVIGEGKKREVRQLMTAAGLEVDELTRIRIGALHLGAIPVGTWRPMTPREQELIFE